MRSLLLDWYLGSQKLREILTLLCCITLSSSRKTNASSRRSKKDFWRRCRGSLRSSQDIPSTHHKLISLAFTLFAICLSFSSPPLHPCHFICPLFLSFRFPFSICSCVRSVTLTLWLVLLSLLSLPNMKFLILRNGGRKFKRCLA